MSGDKYSQQGPFAGWSHIPEEHLVYCSLKQVRSLAKVMSEISPKCIQVVKIVITDENLTNKNLTYLFAYMKSALT